MKLKKILGKTIILIVLLLLGIYIPNTIVQHQSKGKTYNDISSIPKNKVGLILGAVKIAPSGNINLYYQYRLEAAITLYKAGKIEYILVSGDNGRKDYDEPSDFKNDLIKAGIPEDKIYLDYAGFRTLDSVVRAKEIFGQEQITIISQKFHNERAIYLAGHKGVKAIGFNARDIGGRYGKKTKLRERLARTKAFIDVVFNVQPKYLGEKIVIG
ncbi:ElyC/SanA/YdcF family protein [Winogradskyella sp. 3972H.M.0a.05]|uniref:SanA/YdcF family protein n=1 Tax=Winogradskyella sp. 3972H.M.0a.05 TaxID=2950277 RepID=UPI00339AAC03